MSLAPGTHVVSVTARGRVPFSRAFEVTRDASISVSARQATTTQRKIAYGVFSAAAAAAIAGTVTLALANSTDGEATDLLETTRTRALEPAEPARYESFEIRAAIVCEPQRCSTASPVRRLQQRRSCFWPITPSRIPS